MMEISSLTHAKMVIESANRALSKADCPCPAGDSLHDIMLEARDDALTYLYTKGDLEDIAFAQRVTL